MPRPTTTWAMRFRLRGGSTRRWLLTVSALHFKPDYAEVYDHVGLVLQAQGRLDEAVDWFNKALRAGSRVGRDPHELRPGLPPEGGLRAGLDRV